MLSERKIVLDRRRRADAALGREIRLERERQNMTQAGLAEKAALGSFQAVSQIERGVRRLQLDELSRISKALNHDFTRTSQILFGNLRPLVIAPSVMHIDKVPYEEFVDHCFLFSELEKLCGFIRNTRLPSPPPQALTTPKDAGRFGEEIRIELGLSHCPSESIEETLRRQWGVLLVYCSGLHSAPQFASGPFGKAIQLKGRLYSPETSWQAVRGLFYLLLGYESSVELAGKAPAERSRLEELAKAFSSGLLLPAREFLKVLGLWASEAGELSYRAVREIAGYFHCTRHAVCWRLLTLGLLEAPEVYRYEKETRMPPPRRKNRRRLFLGEPQPLDPYSALAVRAYQKGAITEEDLVGKFKVDRKIKDSLQNIGRDKLFLKLKLTRSLL